MEQAINREGGGGGRRVSSGASLPPTTPPPISVRVEQERRARSAPSRKLQTESEFRRNVDTLYTKPVMMMLHQRLQQEEVKPKAQTLSKAEVLPLRPVARAPVRMALLCPVSCHPLDIGRQSGASGLWGTRCQALSVLLKPPSDPMPPLPLSDPMPPLPLLRHDAGHTTLFVTQLCFHGWGTSCRGCTTKMR